jgi:hypothetical protein
VPARSLILTAGLEAFLVCETCSLIFQFPRFHTRRGNAVWDAPRRQGRCALWGTLGTRSTRDGCSQHARAISLAPRAAFTGDQAPREGQGVPEMSLESLKKRPGQTEPGHRPLPPCAAGEDVRFAPELLHRPHAAPGAQERRPQGRGGLLASEQLHLPDKPAGVGSPVRWAIHVVLGALMEEAVAGLVGIAHLGRGPGHGGLPVL